MDNHRALKTEQLGKGRAAGVEFTLVRLIWGKDSSGLSLHAIPTQFRTSGIQQTDLLAYAGFSRDVCPFLSRECYSRRVVDGFLLDDFCKAFDGVYATIERTDRDFSSCGHNLPYPEGLGYFSGRNSGRGRPMPDYRGRGDGHAAGKVERLKQAQDEMFQYVLTWIDLGHGEKGWTSHYLPKIEEVPAGVAAALSFIGLHSFGECPEFDFSPCSWRFIAHRANPDSSIENNAESVHKAFDGHPQVFPRAVCSLLESSAALEPHDMAFLQLATGGRDRPSRPTSTPTRPRPPGPGNSPMDESFDVAVSFAGAQREMAEALSRTVRDAGFKVFFDGFYKGELWGKDLPTYFDEVYRKKARFCVIFVSNDYAAREWTNNELRSALARAVKEKGSEYILPVQVEEVDLPGLPPTLGHLSITDHSIDEIAELLIRKLREVS